MASVCVSAARSTTGPHLSWAAMISLEELTENPHPALARIRPVGWVDALGGWVVASREHAMAVMRDPETFTVDDPRFSTAQVVGPSMLSLDGAAHKAHRDPFESPFGLAETRRRFTTVVQQTVDDLIAAIQPTTARRGVPPSTCGGRWPGRCPWRWWPTRWGCRPLRPRRCWTGTRRSPTRSRAFRPDGR